MPGAKRTVEIAPTTGGWLRAPAGSLVSVIDTSGEQIADFWAVKADFSEWLGCAHTRGATGRLFPKVGEQFWSTTYKPLLTFVEDTSPSVHDALWRACDPDLLKLAGCTDDAHPSCNTNFRKCAKEFGWTPEQVPDPVDFFQNTPFEGGEMKSLRPVSKAGDKVVLRAEEDLIVIVAACSWDMNGSKVNGDVLTGITLEVEEPEGPVIKTELAMPKGALSV
ncbi:hypothetical protein DFJ74DRAFT_686283 [Hyaloraphidium curvatum]|nr:hypothetical protein DFJ74DRAFT_686283 [Hyaloraphidium curvatum]